MEEGLLKRLMSSIKCGVCGQRYEVDDINVLGHQEDLWFLSALCPACHTRCLVAAVIREGKVPELITDLSEAELDRFRNAVQLTADEMLDMHNFLKDFDGDFSRLFSPR
jgi:hypothetical protein